MERDFVKKDHYETLYFQVIGEPLTLLDSDSSIIFKDSDIYKKYKDTFNNFEKERYWVNDDGSFITFDLNKHYSKLYIIDKIDGTLCKVPVKQVSISWD